MPRVILFSFPPLLALFFLTADDGPPLNQQAKEVVWDAARQMIASIRKDRFHPALIDGKPCQAVFGLIMEPPHIH